ncbi:hypothetical protein SNEBB_007290 [Seison nebaliae]|nr:hypothetical protein SNEBB_007290 [Seison nebaliae]
MTKCIFSSFDKRKLTDGGFKRCKQIHETYDESPWDSVRNGECEKLRQSGQLHYCKTKYLRLLTCFPPSPVNQTVIMPCPSKVLNIVLNPNANVSMRCSWNATGNFSYWDKSTLEHDCLQKTTNTSRNDQFRTFQLTIDIIYGICHIISIITLLIGIIIFTRYRKLKCLRNRLHINFFYLLLLTCIMHWVERFSKLKIFQNIFHLMKLSNGNQMTKWQSFTNYNTVFLLIIEFLEMYVDLAKFVWMVCECLYLVCSTVVPFTVEAQYYVAYLALGWGIPLIISIIWLICKIHFSLLHYQPGLNLWLLFERPRTNKKFGRIYDEFMSYDQIVNVSIITILCINLLLFLGMIIFLITKLRSFYISQQTNLEFTHAKKLCKSLLIVFLLFGIPYLILLKSTNRVNELSGRLYLYLCAILQGSQGSLVSILLCFISHDVRQLIRRRVERFRLQKSIKTNYYGTRAKYRREAAPYIWNFLQSIKKKSSTLTKFSWEETGNKKSSTISQPTGLISTKKISEKSSNGHVSVSFSFMLNKKTDGLMPLVPTRNTTDLTQLPMEQFEEKPEENPSRTSSVHFSQANVNYNINLNQVVINDHSVSIINPRFKIVNNYNNTHFDVPKKKSKKRHCFIRVPHAEFETDLDDHQFNNKRIDSTKLKSKIILFPGHSTETDDDYVSIINDESYSSVINFQEYNNK